MKEETCDVLIIGAGPSGLSAAVELLQSAAGKVVIIDKGEPINLRFCPALHSGQCLGCPECAILSGVGGASGMLGGQLCFFPAGDRLAKHTGFSQQAGNYHILRFLKKIGFDLPTRNFFGIPFENSQQQMDSLVVKGYKTIPLLNSDMRALFCKIINWVHNHGGEFRTHGQVIDVLPGGNGFAFKVTYMHHDVPKIISVRHSLLLAAGRSGAQWASGLFHSLGIVTQSDTVDVGVRLEIPSVHVNDLVPQMGDPKIKIYQGTPREVRTLCWCRSGQLTLIRTAGVPLLDGQFGSCFTPRTSVSIVSRQMVPEDLSPFEYAMTLFPHLASLNKPLHQEIAGFLGLHPSKGGAVHDTTYPIPFKCQDSNISNFIDKSLLEDLREMICNLDLLVKGQLVNARAARVYAPVIDKYWMTPPLDANLMTPIPGLYIAGDATGLGRGIVQALFGGLVVAHSIIAQVQNRSQYINSSFSQMAA